MCAELVPLRTPQTQGFHTTQTSFGDRETRLVLKRRKKNAPPALMAVETRKKTNKEKSENQIRKSARSA